MFLLRHWALIVADFRREYQMPADELAGLSWPEFSWLLRGLSGQSRFNVAWSEAPKNLYDPDEIAAVTAAARR